MQLRLERNILHMYTAGTTSSGGRRRRGSGVGVSRTCDRKYEFNLQFEDFFLGSGDTLAGQRSV